MNRRSFMQTLAALLGGTIAAPSLPQPLRNVAAVPEDLKAIPATLDGLPKAYPALNGLAIRSLSVEAGAPQVIDITSLEDRAMRKTLAERPVLRIEAYLDPDSLKELTAAYRNKEAVELDLPILRTFGVGRGAWDISRYELNACADSLATVNIEMTPVGGLRLIEPTGEVGLPMARR